MVMDRLLHKCAAAFIFSALPLFLAVAQAAAPDEPGSRIALVIGNARYPQMPLLNPVNDAQAFSALLQRAGFRVDKLIDARQQDLQQAAIRFGAAIRDPKVKFALVYYAGHGVQLDWRNYLIPVNANVRTSDDVRAQAVDVTDLLIHMKQAQGKNFLVILDACRDNPFGASYRPAAKGLTQFDAPAGSLLAFSTAPGQVALDGEGANGLYTSHLLRELEVRGARVEEVFKRVRLNVRLASKGQQVPWESTSLEDDVYLFPTQRQQLTEAQREALLDEEIKRWTQVKSAQEIDPLVEFIRQFPSGSTSELAQAKLSRMLQSQDELARQQAQANQRAEQARLQQEEKLRFETQQRRAEELRIAGEKRQAQERLALARLEAERLGQADETQRRAAAERLVQAQRVADAKLAEEVRVQAVLKAQRAEQEALALAQEKRLAAERQQQMAQAALEKPPVTPAVVPQMAPVSLTSTPYFQGYDEHRRLYRVGDEYEFRVLDGFSGRELPLMASGVRTPLRIRVTAVDAKNDRIEFNGGEYVTDLMGNTLKHLTGTFDEPRQFYPAELFVGKRWKTEFRQERSNGLRYTFRYTLRVVGREKITVPAGTFDAYRIEAEGFNMQLGASLKRKIWVVPGISADIANETLVRLSNGTINQYDRQELVKFPATARL